MDDRNLGLSLMRATEAAALAASRWVGKGDALSADLEASKALYAVIHQIDMDGTIVVGEEPRHEEQSVLVTGAMVGNGNGPEMDVVVNAIEGVRLLAEGLPDAASVVALARRDSMRCLAPSAYMQKLVVDATAAHAIGPEALSAPPAWTLGVIARAMGKPVGELTVFVLKRPRHEDLIEDIRMAGARVLLREQGDLIGAVQAAMPDSGIDVLMGIGGTAEGLAAVCAVKALGGAVYGRLAPQSDEEKRAILDAGLDSKTIYSGDELVASEDVFFAATGITDGQLLRGVRYNSRGAKTHSIVLRGKTGICRHIYSDHPARRKDG